MREKELSKCLLLANCRQSNCVTQCEHCVLLCCDLMRNCSDIKSVVCGYQVILRYVVIVWIGSFKHSSRGFLVCGCVGWWGEVVCVVWLGEVVYCWAQPMRGSGCLNWRSE
jgi:hypothetical protein